MAEARGVGATAPCLGGWAAPTAAAAAAEAAVEAAVAVMGRLGRYTVPSPRPD